ncbi:MAG: hypothetical protein HOP19_07890 [Acidobacteria bacterium]|nr:hypothetical protein [Acidobacteriota bacterium]
MTRLEQAIETAKQLRPVDRRQLREWLQVQERLDAAVAASPAPAVTAKETPEEQLARFRKAQQWIKEHRAEYLGQWVVLVGDRLISHGFDGRRVDEEAIAAGIEVPFLVQIQEEPGPNMTGIIGPVDA